jgi:hypothetical protein
VRLESGDSTDCAVLPVVTSLPMPRPLPAEPAGDQAEVGQAEVAVAGRAAATLAPALQRYLTDAACASLLPPCGDCADSDVLLAEVELDGCDVVRICAGDRPQVLPGGPGYAAWAQVLPEARALAGELCCEPVGFVEAKPPAGEGPVPMPYAANLMAGPSADSDLDRLLHLLRGTAPEPAAEPAVVPVALAAPAPAAQPARRELAELRDRVGALTRLVESLRATQENAAAGSTRDQPRADDGSDTNGWAGPGSPPPEEPDEPAGSAASEESAEPVPAAKRAPAAAKQSPAAKKAPAKKAAPRRARGRRAGEQES